MWNSIIFNFLSRENGNLSDRQSFCIKIPKVCQFPFFKVSTHFLPASLEYLKVQIANRKIRQCIHTVQGKS